MASVLRPTVAADVAGALTGKSLVRQASVYGAFTILRRIVSIALTPLYTHYLTPADFGTLELLSVAGLFVTILGGFKLDAAFYRYYVASQTPEERQRVLSSAILATLVVATAIIGGAFAVLLAAGTPARTGVPVSTFVVLLSTLWLELMTAVPLAYCRANDRASFVGAVSAAQALVTGVSAVVLLSLTDLSYLAVLVANLLATGVTAAICVVALSSERLVRTLALTPELLRYAVPMLPGSLFMYVLTSTDRYFLAHFATLDDVGIYAVALKFALALQLLVMGPFGEMWAANQFKLFERGQKALYERVALGYLGLLFGMAIGVGFFSYEFLQVAFAPQYRTAYRVVPLVTLGVALWGIVPTLDLGSLVTKGKTWIRSVATGIGAAAAVAGDLVLVPRLGVYGAALAALGGFVVLVMATGVLNARLVSMRAPGWKVLVMVVVSATAMSFAYTATVLPYPMFVAGRIVVFATAGAVLLRVTGGSLSGLAERVGWSERVAACQSQKDGR